MRGVVIIIITFFFLLLQLVLVNRISLGSISPDFPTLIVVFLALYRPVIHGTVIGFIIGLVQDLFNPLFLGLNALIKSVLGFTVGEVAARTVPENPAFIALIFFASQIGHDLLYMVVYFSLDVGAIISMFFTRTIPSAVYTAAVGIIIHEAGRMLGIKVVKAVGKAQQQR